MKKRLLAGILSLCMVVSLIPTSVFAAETGTKKVCAEGCTLEADHDGDCKLPKDCESGCTLEEGHDGDCVLPKECDSACTLEEGHDGECVLPKECDPDCTLEEGHEGACVLPTKCTEEGCNLEFNHEGDHKTAKTVTGEIETKTAAVSLRVTSLAAQSESITTAEALRNAISNANTGDEITLEQDIVLDSTLTINKSLTLDGGESKYTIDYTGNGKAIDVQADNVTIKNVTVKAPSNETSQVPVQFYNVSNGKLDNVTIEGASYWGVALNVNASTVTVNNLDLSGKGVNVCVGEATEIQGKKSSFDGVFNNVNMIYADEGDCTRGNIVFGESVKNWAKAVVGSEETKTTTGIYYFKDLNTAINAVPDGINWTIKLLNDANVQETIRVDANRSITIDLNGNSVNAPEINTQLFLVSEGDLKVTGKGKLESQGDIFRLEGNIVGLNPDRESKKAEVYIDKEVEVVSTENCCIYIIGKGARADVFGNLKSLGAYATIQGNGMHTNDNNRSDTVVNIYSGATVVQENGMAIYHPQYGILNITGGTIEGKTTGIEIRAGELTVNGGTIIGQGEFKIDPNGNGSTAEGVAVAVSQHTTDLPTTVVIEGGTFNAEKGKAVYIEDVQNDIAQDEVSVTINDGVFNSAVEKISEESHLTVNGGTFNVRSEEEFVFALAAGAKNIVLVNDIELNKMLDITKSVTIDGQGKTITAKSTFAGEGNNRMLVQVKNPDTEVTIKDVVLKTTAKNKHALNVYDAKKVTLNNVTLDHTYAAEGAPLVINSSAIDVDGNFTVITGEQSWYGINVDKKTGVVPTLTIAETAKVSFQNKASTERSFIDTELNDANGTIIKAASHISCNYSYEKTIANGTEMHYVYNLAHTFGNWTVSKAPTCGAKGTEKHECSKCHKIETRDIAATGNHNYGAWQLSSKPTCTTAGSNKSVCSVCGHERYSPIAATGHSYGSDGRCTACGDYDATKVVVTPPAASTTTPATPAPAKPATTPETTETTPAPVENAKPETADTTITKVEASEEVVEAVKETVKVEEGTAKVETETIEKIIEATEEGKEVVLPLTQVTEEAVNKAEVSADALEKVAEKEADVVIQLTDVTVKLDAVAIAAVAEQAQGKNIEIRAVKTETVTLTEKQQDALADKETAIVVTAQIFADGEYIGDFKGGTATIMLPFTPEEGRAAEDYKVYFVDDDGSLTPVPAEYVDGHMVFTTGHFSDYAIVYEKAEAVEDSESDTEVVITPEEASEGTSLPIIPIVVVIAIIVIGGIVLVMRRKKEE